MHIIKWFIEKTKQLVQAYRDRRYRKQVEKWYSAHEVTEEELRQEAEENELEYQQQCKEEDARIAREHQKLQAEILEDRRLERQMEEWSMQEEWENRFDNEKDERNDYPLDDGIDETTLINRQCAAVDPEEEIPLWLEHANEKCPNCRLLPEFCQCQYEE